jgi:hypothetical protein
MLAYSYTHGSSSVIENYFSLPWSSLARFTIASKERERERRPLLFGTLVRLERKKKSVVLVRKRTIPTQ